MTQEQREIYQWAYSVGGRFTKMEAVKQFGGEYYCNERNLIGQRLSRMVNAGLLIRERPGRFKVGKGTKKNRATIIENQIELF